MPRCARRQQATKPASAPAKKPPNNTTSVTLSSDVTSELENWFVRCYEGMMNGGLQYNTSSPSTPNTLLLPSSSTNKSVSFSRTAESATIVGSSTQHDTDGYENENGVVIMSSTATSHITGTSPIAATTSTTTTQLIT